MNKSLLSASLIALALAAPVAHAHQAGDFILRAGSITTAPNEDSGEIKLDGAKQSGTKATLTSDTQLGLAFAYMITDHIGLELLAATPFKHEVGVKGLGDGLPNKTIAYDLEISARTVEVHRANLMAKLGVRSLSDALRIAFAAGLGQD